MIFDRHVNLKYKYRNRHFWARGYYVDTVCRNKKQIQESIRKQLEEDQLSDHMSLKECMTRLWAARIPRHKKAPLRGARKSNADGRPFGTPLGVCLYCALLGPFMPPA